MINYMKNINKGIAPLIVLIIALVVIAAGVGGYIAMKPKIVPVDNNNHSVITPPHTMEIVNSAEILSFSITPSKLANKNKDFLPKVIYNDGANIVLTGRNIASAEVLMLDEEHSFSKTPPPPESYTKIILHKKKTIDGIETWQASMPIPKLDPRTLSAIFTNFQGYVTGYDGKVIKSNIISRLYYERPVGIASILISYNLKAADTIEVTGNGFQDGGTFWLEDTRGALTSMPYEIKKLSPDEYNILSEYSINPSIASVHIVGVAPGLYNIYVSNQRGTSNKFSLRIYQ